MNRVLTVLRRLQDLTADVAADLSAKPVRTAIMLAAIAVSVGSLIASEAVSASSARQISDQLATTALEHVTVAQQSDGDPLLGPEAAKTAAGVTQVVAAESVLTVPIDEQPVRRLPRSTEVDGLTVMGAAAGLFPIRSAQVTPVHTASSWDALAARPVAILGTDAAEAIGVHPGPGAEITIGTQRFAVIGTARSSADPAVARTVFIPFAAAQQIAGPNRPELVVRTVRGASSPVAAVLPAVLSPANPAAVTTRGAENFGDLRRGVSTSLDGLLRSIGAMLWLLTLLIVATTMVVTVMSRTAEIGLRRALGFSRTDIAAKFTAEAIVVGVLGGLGGIGLGCAGALLAAAALGWTPQFPIWLAAAGPLLGAATGVLAAAYPAWHAARVRPSEAVRSD